MRRNGKRAIVSIPMPTRIAVFDTETTGVDHETARIITAFVGVMDVATEQITERWSWVIDPGVEIPKEASDVHGYTTERAQIEGVAPAGAIFEIIQRLDILDRQGLALVIMNAPFDLTILDREQQRHWPDIRPFTPRLVFDPMVLDGAFDKYRKGKRTLSDLVLVYGVPLEANAHDAEADCRMAGRVAIRLMGHSRIANLPLSEVHRKLVITKRNQAADLANFWESKKLPHLPQSERAEMIARIENVRAVGGFWPMIPRPGDPARMQSDPPEIHELNGAN